MSKFSDLTLTSEQEQFVDEWMYKWGAWIRSGRIDKAKVNIIAKLMQSVIPSDPNESICNDDEGFMISQVVEQFFAKNDRTLHFIIFAHYVNKRTVNFIANKLRERCVAIPMQPCAGKSNIRIPCLKTVKRNVEKDLMLAKSIIHELLITGFVLLRTGSEKSKNIKIRY